MKNAPYVKEFDAEGNQTNKFKDKYEPLFPNRKKRRAKDGRFNSNRKGANIVTVLGRTFKKILQEVDGKYIYHYKPINQK